jgi:Holliday junction DNA helicase RuvB
MKKFEWRPRTLDEFIGQASLRRELSVELSASIAQRRPLNHMCFFGPGGLGKTSLAQVLAHDRGVPCVELMGKTLTHDELTIALLSNKSPGYDLKGRLVNPEVAVPTVYVIDEAQKVDRELLNLLHPVLEPTDENGILTFDGMHPTTKEVKRIWVRRCTFIFITNYMGELVKSSAATFSRVPIQKGFQWYSNDELASLLTLFAKHCEISVDPAAIAAIACRSNGVPRQAIAFLRRAVDFASSVTETTITEATVSGMFDVLGISADGLDRTMMEYLRVLSQASGRMGLQGIVSVLGEDEQTIATYIEPTLMRRGLVARSSGGRSLTHAGRAILAAGGQESDDFYAQAV